MNSFSPIGQRKSISQQVEEQLVNAIRSGAYLPKQKIPTEGELCELFDVSRTTIREAIQKLHARGIVDIKRGSGVYVSEMSISNASEILNMFFQLSSDEDILLQTIQVRLLIEPIIAAQAALNRTDGHLNSLASNLELMEKCELGDIKTETELDNEFHKTLLSIANNKVLELLFYPIFNLTPKFSSIVFAKIGSADLQEDKNIMLGHHQSILNAIRDKDEVQASDCMSGHIAQTLENYKKSVT